MLVERVKQQFRLALLEVLVAAAAMPHAGACPLLHVGIAHIRQHHAALGKHRLFFLAKVHVEKPLGPVGCRVVLAPPRRVVVVAVVVVVHVGHAVALEMQIHREAAHRGRNGIYTAAECRSQQVTVGQLQGACRVCVRNHIVGGHECFAVHLHAGGVGVVAHNVCHFLPRDHRAAVALYGLCQSRCHNVAAAHNAKCALVIEVHDERVGRERRLAFLGGI